MKSLNVCWWGWCVVTWGWLIGAAGQESTIPVTPGEIREVTLYRDQALVTRWVTVPDEFTGQELLIGSLPEQTVLDSVYAEGLDDLEVSGVRITQRVMKEAAPQELRDLKSQISELDQQIAQQTRQLEIATASLGYLDQVMAFSVQASHADLNRGTLDADALTKVADYSMQQQEALRLRQFETQQQLQTLNEQRNYLTAQLGLLTQVDRTVHEVRVVLAAPAVKGNAVRLSYVVRGCGWSPRYTVHGHSGKTVFSVRYSAIVHQLTGEDWRKVQLTLSTSSPGINAAGPALVPFRIGLGQQGVPVQASKDDPFSSTSEGDPFRVLPSWANQAGPLQQRVSELSHERSEIHQKYSAEVSQEQTLQRDYALNTLANTVQSMELEATSQLAKSIAADVNDHLSSQTYRLDDRLDLQSRKEQQWVRVFDADLQGELYHVATPLLSSHVYREAELVNDRREGLLRGPASIYLDDQFVGQTEVPSAASGQHFVIGFGTDPQVRTRRELLVKEDDVQGGNRRMHYSYRLVLANFKSQAVQVRLFDRRPLPSNTQQLDVRMEPPEMPLSSDGIYKRMQEPRGILRWDVEVPPQSFGETSFDIQYRYSLEFDRNLNLGTTLNRQQLEIDHREMGRGMGGGMGGMGGGMFGSGQGP